MVILGVSLVAVSAIHSMFVLALAMLVAGAAWIVFISIVNTLTQLLAPDWVRARVLVVFLLVFQGSLAAGSALCGSIAARSSIHTAVLAAGVGVVLSLILNLAAPLPAATADTSPWIHWRKPTVFGDAHLDLDAGPVLVTSEYGVSPESASEFLAAMTNYSRLRRRDGAYQWGVFKDLEKADRYVETFLVVSGPNTCGSTSVRRKRIATSSCAP